MIAFAEETRLCNIRSSSFWDADISMDNVVVLVGNISRQTKTYIGYTFVAKPWYKC